MVDPTEPAAAPIPNPTNELAELLRLHFEASRHELSEYLEQWAKQALGTALTASVTVVLAGLGGLFMLIAVVLAVGDALGHPGWGLLIVGTGLVVAGGGFALARWLIGKNREAPESGQSTIR